MNLKNVRIKGNDKLNLIVGLRTMLTAGIPILEAVDILAVDAKGGLKIYLKTLEEDLTQGKTISSSCAKFPLIFDKVTINVLKAAEESGTLETSLKDLQTNLQKEIQFNDKIRAAALYPLVVVVVFIMVVTGILLFVIPRIAKVFTSLKLDLPLPTKILIFLSNTLINQWIFILLGLAVIILTFIYIYLRKRGLLINTLFSLPLISSIIRQIDLTRFCRSMALLLESGLPIVTCLDLAKDVMFKNDVRKAIAQSREMVASGKKMSDGMKKFKKIIPPIVVKIIEAGERSGSLSESMQFAYEHIEYQVEKKLATITTLIEPVMLVLIGLVIGTIMLSIISPIYSLIGQIGPK